jgi:hypothetical protein
MRYLLLSVVIVLMVGCTSRIPEPIAYPYSQQLKMQASEHWEVLAQDLANRINNELIKSDNIDKAVFVEETCGDERQACEPLQTSAFNEAFHDLLITSLVDLGVPTKNKTDEESIEILYKVQVVRHNAQRFRTLQPGLLTAISAAIVVLRNAPTNLVILATGVGADIANSSLSINQQSEVIITTSMVTDDKYLFRASDIYYINDKDFWHYQEGAPQATTIRLSTPVKNAINNNMPSSSTTEVKPSGEQAL